MVNFSSIMHMPQNDGFPLAIFPTQPVRFYEPSLRFLRAMQGCDRFPHFPAHLLFSFASSFPTIPNTAVRPTERLPTVIQSTIQVSYKSVPSPTPPFRDPTSIHRHDRALGSPQSHDHNVRTIPFPPTSAGIKYMNLHSLSAYNTPSTSRLKSL